MSLTPQDVAIISRARELAAADAIEDFRRILGEKPGAEPSYVRAGALGLSQHLLAELADLAERLAGKPDVPDAVVAAWCKGCHRATPSVPCQRCGKPVAACANCGRCPDCDGPIVAGA